MNRGFRSTPRTASTARPATSRTRPRTSTGSLPKAAEAPITRTCKWLAGAALAALALAPVPAAARGSRLGRSARTYVQARAAAMSGDHARAAQLLAALAAAQPDQVDLASKALSEAIGAGQMDLALQPGADDPGGQAADRRAAAAGRRRGQAPAAGARAAVARGRRGDNGDLTLPRAADHAPGTPAERGDADQALATHRPDPGRTACSARSAPRNSALILLKFRRDRRSRAVRAARDRRGRRRARTGCGWPSPTASSPPATARGR